jgi:ABC-2 type transport system permease protein
MTVKLDITPPVKPRAAGLKLFAKAAFARAYPRFVWIFRELDWIFFETLLPLLGTAAYVFVYRAIGAKAEYTGFVIVGGAMIAFWLNVIWSMGTQLYWDREAGNLPLYILSPAPLSAILLGMAVGGLFNTLFRAAVILITGTLIFQISYSTDSIGGLLLTFAVTMVALYGLGMMLASLFLIWGREGQHLANLFSEPIMFIGGFYFPVKALGTVIGVAASLLPLTLGMDAMRQLLFPSDLTFALAPVTTELIALAVLGVLFVSGAQILLRYIETVARTQGGLVTSKG